MPRKPKKIPRSSASLKRGRPRRDIAPEALLPFKKHEVATIESLRRLEKPAGTKKKSLDKRYLNPATSDRHYTSAEVEFMNALNEFKRSSGHLFPTCSEILTVLQNLGYEKVQHTEQVLEAKNDVNNSSFLEGDDNVTYIL